jgi:hypothetical protein
MSRVKEWFSTHYTLIFFLIGQAAIILAYSVRLETRVNTLETRGSPHLEKVDNRLTVLESQTTANKERIDNVVEIMTKKLNVNP